MDFSLPGSSVHGIFQAKVLEWGAIAFSDTTAAGIVKAVSVALENWLGYTRFFKTTSIKIFLYVPSIVLSTSDI